MTSKSVLPGYKGDSIIAKGPNGTVVYKGQYQERPVAIKRVSKDHYQLSTNLQQLLSFNKENGNDFFIIPHYYCEESDQFWSLAMPVCLGPLDAFIKQSFKVPNTDKLKVLLHITKAVKYLHEKNISPCHIKPSNILITSPSDDPENQVHCVIGDLAFNPCSEADVSSNHSGWKSPESLSGKSPIDYKSSDIFSLGCLFYFILTNGKHPFGLFFQRNDNILKDNIILDSNVIHPTQKNLVEHMINHDANKRPSLEAILMHPLFWNEEKILQFLRIVYSQIILPQDIKSQILDEHQELFRGNWMNQLDPEIQKHLKRFGKYDETLLSFLIRAMYSLANQYDTAAEEVRRKLGSGSVEFCQYFTSRFPSLLIQTWVTVQEFKHLDDIKPFYPQDFRF